MLQLTKQFTVELVKESAPAVKLDDKYYKLVSALNPTNLLCAFHLNC